MTSATFARVYGFGDSAGSYALVTSGVRLHLTSERFAQVTAYGYAYGSYAYSYSARGVRRSLKINK